MTNSRSISEDEIFLSALGRLVISWAQAEASLDFIIMHIYQKYGKHIEPEIPRSLSRKLKFLKKAANLIGDLASYKERILSFVDTLDKASAKRHDLVHGFMAQPNAERGFSFIRILDLKQVDELIHFEIKNSSFTTAEILQEALVVLRTSTRGLEIARDVRVYFDQKIS